MTANLLYAQSGGMTAVINASACGVIEAARARPERFGKVFAARDGIVGALTEQLYDLDAQSDAAIAALRHLPGGAFGSCRYDLQDIATHRHQYERLIEVFAAHDIGYFLYNGGGGSMLTAERLLRVGESLGYPLKVMGVPKTIDNDLADTDTSPGFGSAAKYVAVSAREAAHDVASMAGSSTKVFILEVMGRHAGWLAAAGGLAERAPGELPLLLLFAERAFDEATFLAAVRARVTSHGYCVIVASEGLKDAEGQFLSISADSPVYAWIQLGGVAAGLAGRIKQQLGYRTHWAVADYLQRSARHIASRTDLEQAYACGRAAVELLAAGEHGRMITLRRLSDAPYRWETDSVPLATVADVECTVPAAFIDAEGFGITEAARRHLRPLIEGEDYPPFRDGIPDYPALRLELAPRRLPDFTLD
ncbi:6-phosphofructokinase [Acidihalobacter prosperus]|uniref:Pyrophosphate--fructose 6-phosphate 1-phosphotransferase n=1 Tax=Acidihalobacter prosperus TaxID=160660 RepID=A0A1A6C4J3_9GAMM|nr:6-phosphofructokinase [Acidihalobacter prosperus]OBS09465.1 6-phosphofructokinase [Acidihalobacter prosperus]